MTGKLNSGPIIEALLQEPLGDGYVRCRTCHRECVMAEGQTGWCRARKVRGGRLQAVTYGGSRRFPAIRSRRSRFTISIPAATR
jgi:hypothetical protein